MRHSLRVLLGLGLALSAAGCSDYLSGPGISSTSDPNNVIALSKPGPLYIAIQQAGVPQHQGQAARDAVQYVQQTAGISRQSIGFDLYQTSPNDMDAYFGAIYGSTNNLTGGGGLLDIHKMQQLARTKGDSLYIGVGKVYEAIGVGLGADIWGDIPYRTAVDSNIPQPTYDPQLQVYGDIQTQLDSAITVFLAAAGVSNVGGSLDGSELIYGGRDAAGLRAVYTAVAHSLRARYYLHVGDYANAAAQAAQGISTPDDDFLWFASAEPGGPSVWFQYNQTRTGDIGPGAALIEIMKRQITNGFDNNQRLAFYFTTSDGAAPAVNGSNFFGYRGAGATGLTTASGIYNGNPPNSGFGAFITPTKSDGAFRHPEITYAETQLIAAEAAWHLNGGGADPTAIVVAAQPFLNAARTNRHYGNLDGAAVTFGDAPGILPASLQNIIEEKYIALFLNPEVWNDYKRTCLPSLAPTPPLGSATPGVAPIPGRLPYGITEINANPNTPGGQGPATNSAGISVTSISQNPNTPTACPVLNYTSSTPLAN